MSMFTSKSYCSQSTLPTVYAENEHWNRDEVTASTYGDDEFENGGYDSESDSQGCESDEDFNCEANCPTPLDLLRGNSGSNGSGVTDDLEHDLESEHNDSGESSADAATTREVVWNVDEKESPKDQTIMDKLFASAGPVKTLKEGMFFGALKFPPRTPEELAKEIDALPKLIEYGPAIIGMTAAADRRSNRARDANQREYTHALRQMSDVPLLQHQTCVDQTKEELQERTRELTDNIQVSGILRLKGWSRTQGGHRAYTMATTDFIAMGKDAACKNIAAACYMEGHKTWRREVRAGEEIEDFWAVDSPHGQPIGIRMDDFQAGIDFDVQKQNAGASLFICQMIWDVDLFFKYARIARERGLTARIVPQIYVGNTLKEFLKRSDGEGIYCPDGVRGKMAALDRDGGDDAVQAYWVEYMLLQSASLKMAGYDMIYLSAPKKNALDVFCQAAFRRGILQKASD